MRTRVFLWPFGFRGSASKLSLLLISWGTFLFHGAGKECHGSQDLGTNSGGSSLGSDEELAWWFMTWSSGMLVGATAQEKCVVLSFWVKIEGLASICCACQCPYWRLCFESEDFLQGENLWSMIGRWRWSCPVSFLEALLLEKLDLSDVLVVLVLLLQGIDHSSRIFSFSF
jgi:hypothetical protein